MAAYL